MVNCIDASVQGVKDYIKKSQERLVTTADYSIDNMSTDRKRTKLGSRISEEKQLCGYFKRQTGDIEHVRREHGNESDILSKKMNLF